MPARRVIVVSGLARTESRGAHQREDFPNSDASLLKNQAAELKGTKVVVYHTSWTYLLDWLDIEAVAALEPKPGIPPTTSHLESVLQAVKGQEVGAILIAPFEDDKAADWLSERTKIPVLTLPYTVGGSAKADSLEALFEETLTMLRDASS